LASVGGPFQLTVCAATVTVIPVTIVAFFSALLDVVVSAGRWDTRIQTSVRVDVVAIITLFHTAVQEAIATLSRLAGCCAVVCGVIVAIITSLDARIENSVTTDVGFAVRQAVIRFVVIAIVTEFDADLDHAIATLS
jgi:hypothetical protein